MREILFRGKHKGPRKWVEGSLVDYGDGDFDICVKSGAPGMLYKFHVYPETVGQYTGLTDKNGVKIFEGDIIECWSEGVKAKGTVQQNRGGLWIIYPAWQKHIMWGLCPNEDGSTNVQIIGNIHDNPELLGGKP